MIIVKPVHQKAGGYDVVGRNVGLHFGQVAEPPDGVLVLSGGKLGADHVIVLAIQTVKEPDFSFHDGARDGESRIHFIERPAFLVLK